MAKGWICLYRSILETPLWKDKPFNKGAAWIDLLLMVNHKDNEFLFGNQMMLVKRGSVITSEVKLSERWGWGRKKTRSFLKLLEVEQMIVKKGTSKYTSISIVKYDDYQNIGTAKEQLRNIKGTAEEQLRNTNNNEEQCKTMNNKKEKILSCKHDGMTEKIREIVSYLNEMSGQKYKTTSRKTHDLIQARLNEGFTVDDFKIVIQKKCYDWLHDPKMSAYLRPVTLFGTKFESYLNQKSSTKQVSQAERQQSALDEWVKKQKEANHDSGIRGNTSPTDPKRIPE